MRGGSTPKAEGKAVTRHRPTTEQLELGTAPADGSAPKIPRAEWRKLHPRTKEWWNVWLEAPQASQFVGTDWQRLRGFLLPLVENFNRALERGEVKLAKELAGELRLQEQDFGATPAARLRNRWVIRRPGQDSASEQSDDKPERKPRAVHGDPRRLQAVK